MPCLLLTFNLVLRRDNLPVGVFIHLCTYVRDLSYEVSGKGRVVTIAG